MKLILSKSQWEHIGKEAGWLKEAHLFGQISPSDLSNYIVDRQFYGLITPDGSLYECGAFGHYDLVSVLEGKSFNYIDDGKVYEKLGYVRVGINARFSNRVEFEGSKETMKKHKALLAQIQQQYSDWLEANSDHMKAIHIEY